MLYTNVSKKKEMQRTTQVQTTNVDTTINLFCVDVFYNLELTLIINSMVARGGGRFKRKVLWNNHLHIKTKVFQIWTDKCKKNVYCIHRRSSDLYVERVEWFCDPLVNELLFNSDLSVDNADCFTKVKSALGNSETRFLGIKCYLKTKQKT